MAAPAFVTKEGFLYFLSGETSEDTLFDYWYPGILNTGIVLTELRGIGGGI